MADAANELLAALRGGTLKVDESLSGDSQSAAQVASANDQREQEQSELIEEFNSYSPGVANHPILLPDDQVVYLDVAWPEGLQSGISQPAAYLFDPDDEVVSAANQVGFLVFTNRDQLHYYVGVIEGEIEVELD